MEQAIQMASLTQELMTLDDLLKIRHEGIARCDQLGDSTLSAEFLLTEHHKLLPEAKARKKLIRKKFQRFLTLGISGLAGQKPENNPSHRFFEQEQRSQFGKRHRGVQEQPDHQGVPDAQLLFRVLALD